MNNDDTPTLVFAIIAAVIIFGFLAWAGSAFNNPYGLGLPSGGGW